MKTVIVATYFQRQAQLVRTLKSITPRPGLEMVIVDDGSPDTIILPPVSFPVTVIRTFDKDWIDRDIPANIGFNEALNRGADVVISQNAECYHVGDVLGYAETVTDENYIAFSAFSEDHDHSGTEYNLNELIEANNSAVTIQGGAGWYNHPVHRAVAYDFCAAMTRNTLVKLNGFDERFSYGLNYGDDDFVRRIKALGLRIDIPPDPFVVHQWHYSIPRKAVDQDSIRNHELMLALAEEGNIKALHIKTPDFV